MNNIGYISIVVKILVSHAWDFWFDTQQHRKLCKVAYACNPSIQETRGARVQGHFSCCDQPGLQDILSKQTEQTNKQQNWCLFIQDAWDKDIIGSLRKGLSDSNQQKPENSLFIMSQYMNISLFPLTVKRFRKSLDTDCV